MKYVFGLLEGIEFTPLGEVLRQIGKYVALSLNASYIEEFIPVKVIEKLTINEILKEGVDIVLIPFTINSGLDYVHYSFGSTIMKGDVIIWSGPPMQTTETHFSKILVFDLPVLMWMIFCLVVVSLISSINPRYASCSKGRQIRRNVSYFGYILFFYISNFAWSFFRIAMTVKRGGHSFRILMSSWLLIMIVLNNLQGSMLKARMSFPKYYKINTFEDILLYPSSVCKLTINSITHKTLKDKAKGNIKITKVLENIQFLKFRDFFDSDLMGAIQSRKNILIYNDWYFSLLANIFLSLEKTFQFYLSPSQGAAMQSYLLNKNLTKQAKEIANQGFSRIFDCKTFQYCIIKGKMFPIINSWKEDNDVTVINLSNVYFANLILFFGIGFSVIAFLIEITLDI